VVSVDSSRLPPEAAGQAYDEEFLRSLPAHVDPCGERGEFHTFVDAGPLFSRPVPVRPGERVAREGYVYADLLPLEVPLT
jgi:diphthamide synthase (EF-2-diphthine--ammonia ligase)